MCVLPEFLEKEKETKMDANKNAGVEVVEAEIDTEPANFMNDIHLNHTAAQICSGLWMDARRDDQTEEIVLGLYVQNDDPLRGEGKPSVEVEVSGDWEAVIRNGEKLVSGDPPVQAHAGLYADVVSVHEGVVITLYLTDYPPTDDSEEPIVDVYVRQKSEGIEICTV